MRTKRTGTRTPFHVGAEGLRIGQKVCRIVWQNNIPSVHVARVTKRTKRILEVDGERAEQTEWSETHRAAIRSEMRWLFERQFTNKKSGMDETIERLNRLMRLQRKFSHYMRQKHGR